MIKQPERKKGNRWNNLLLKLGSYFRLKDCSTETPGWSNWSEDLEMAHREWKYARLYFDSVTEPDLIDHAIYNLEATEKKYTYLLKRAREIGLRGDGYSLG